MTRTLIQGLLVVLVLFPTTALSAWNLLWEEQFNGSSLDAATWTIEQGGPCCGGTEAWYQTQNVTVSGGSLHLKIDMESVSGYLYTSGGITSSGKREIPGATNFRIEFYAKMPVGAAVWPAMWGFEGDPWYRGYGGGIEVDTLEFFNAAPPLNAVQSLLDWEQGYALQPVQCNTNTGIDYSQGYHSYMAEYANGLWAFYIDGTQRCPPKAWRGLTGRMDIRIAINMGCNYGCAVGMPHVPDTNVYPQYLDVDWVRIYTDTAPEQNPPEAPTQLRVQ